MPSGDSRRPRERRQFLLRGQRGLVGGGAVDAGQVAIVLGNSAVVNSSAGSAPGSGALDAMRLNWGPYLWMRCYSNGAQFLDKVVGPNADWPALEAAARAVPAGSNGTAVLPFMLSEPSVGVHALRFAWMPTQPPIAGRDWRSTKAGAFGPEASRSTTAARLSSASSR